MWRPLFNDVPADEVPIGHVTNGVHLPTFLATPMRELFDRHLGEDWLARASAAVDVGAGRRHPERGAVGRAPRGARAARRVRPHQERPGPAAARRGPRLRQARRRELRPEHPDDRLRPADRHVQAAVPAHLRPRAGAADLRGRPPAADGDRGQGTPARREREAHAAGRLRDAPPDRARRPHHVPRELRPVRCGADRRRLRRLGERPAPSARGLGDERHEVRGERRAQPQRARRLVGRGLRRHERLGDRRRSGRRERAGAGRAPCAGALRPARARGDPALLRPRRGRHPARVARAREGVAADRTARGSPPRAWSRSTPPRSTRAEQPRRCAAASSARGAPPTR